MSDQQFSDIVASFWRPAVAETKSRPLKAIQILSNHTVMLCLCYWGIRAISWLDERYRTTGKEGRYLRWHHLTLRFLGYYEELQPLFILFGSVSGVKHAER